MNCEVEVAAYLRGDVANKKAYFVGTTTKNALSYKVGEKITFRIRAKCDSGYLKVPYIRYSLEGDDGAKSFGVLEPEEDGWFYVKTSVDCPGFVRLIAVACNRFRDEIETIDKFEGGAGAQIGNIVCGTDVPGDYFDFWNWLKDEACKTEPEIIYKKQFYPEKQNTHEFYDVRIKVNDEMYASCLVSYPQKSPNGSLKLKMQYQGYGVASPQIDALDGTMLVSVNAHSLPNLRTDEFYEKYRNGVLAGYGFNCEENQNPKTTYWAKMFMRNYQVVRYFKNHPLVNGKDYIFFGGSQGAMQACNMAVHSGIATECVLRVPWLADLGGNSKFSRMLGWRPDYTNGIRYFDTAVAASYLKCPVDITVGLGDYICPPSGQAAMFNGIQTSKKITYVQNHTHSYEPVEAEMYTLNS